MKTLIPLYLSDLELDQVFAPYAPDVGRHIEESIGNEHIVDSVSGKVCGFVSSSFGMDEDKACKYFTVMNPSASSYALLKIDNGLIKTLKTRKCDCAIANSKEICFIEFKSNATSNDPMRIKENYEKAIGQLSVTIGVFNRYYALNGENIKSLRNVEAYVCFRAGYPRFTSTQMNYKMKFAAQNDGIPLSFSRKKVL